MARQQCSGTQTLSGWTTVAGSCVYQVQLLVDGVAITNTVALNNTMTTTQIEALLNANRINNATGTFTVAIVATNLNITINDIYLTASASGSYTITASGTGFPCGNFPLLLASLTCAVVPNAGQGLNSGFGVFQPQICYKRTLDASGKLVACPDRINVLGKQLYIKISEDNQKCCYRIANANERGSQTFIDPRK